jgi:hypothetical protein
VGRRDVPGPSTDYSVTDGLRWIGNHNSVTTCDQPKRRVSGDGDCPIDAALSVIDGCWKGTILWLLCDGPVRIAQLKRSIPGIYTNRSTTGSSSATTLVP